MAAKDYEYKFITQPDNDLKCVICLDVAREARQHEECGKLFCRECIEKNGKRPCPNCRAQNPHYYKDLKSERSIRIKYNYSLKDYTLFQKSGKTPYSILFVHSNGGFRILGKGRGCEQASHTLTGPPRPNIATTSGPQYYTYYTRLTAQESSHAAVTWGRCCWESI